MSRSDISNETALRAENVTVAYGKLPIVEDLDLEIPRGRFTALLGANGSGKSTILRAFAGLLSPRSGNITLDGRSLYAMSTRDIAARIGMLAQGPTAPEGLTVRDLVQQGRYPHRSLFGRWSREDEAACQNALKLTGMTELELHLLDTLSGGQRQRAWIAMTLAQETDILLLDEPTTFLDIAHQIEVMDLIVDLVNTRGKTVICVLHDLNQAARYADHMVLLKSGAVIDEGAPQTVMTAETIETVFDIRSMVLPDPVTGTPMCLPLPKTDRG